MSQPELCKQCKSRPKFGTYDFCGRTCAEEARKNESSGGWLSSTLGGLFSLDPLPDARYGRSGRPSSRTAERAAYSGGGGPSSGSSGTYVSGGSGGRKSGELVRESFPDDTICEECHLRPKHSQKDPASGQITLYPHCGIKCRNIAAQKNIRRCLMCDRVCKDGYCSDEHAKKAVSKGKVPGCAHCKVFPVNPPFEFCSKECGMRDAANREKSIRSLDELDPRSDVFRAIDNRFSERWNSPEYNIPQVERIYRITLPRKYENRFTEAIAKAETLGGSTTKSAFFGGQCICDIGSDQNNLDLCNWKSCTICIVIRRGFDALEFGNTEHTGKYGKGIYANVNPAKAHRFTVRKAANPFRAMILCSIVQLDEHSRGDRKKYAAITDETGRVYCSSKHFIIPRQLIIYSEPSVAGS